MQRLKLTRLSGECENGNCPTIYVSDRGSLVVQGDAVSHADGLTLGDALARLDAGRFSGGVP